MGVRLLCLGGVWAALVSLSSCSPGGGSTGAFEFQFASSEQIQATVTVLQGSTPVVGATVSFADPVAAGYDSATATSSPNWFQGVTNTSGVCEADFKAPTRLDELDLIVQAAGLKGPYTVESLRADWGPFAPSSRTRVTRSGTLSVTLYLEAK